MQLVNNLSIIIQWLQFNGVSNFYYLLHYRMSIDTEKKFWESHESQELRIKALDLFQNLLDERKFAPWVKKYFEQEENKSMFINQIINSIKNWKFTYVDKDSEDWDLYGFDEKARWFMVWAFTKFDEMFYPIIEELRQSWYTRSLAK